MNADYRRSSALIRGQNGFHDPLGCQRREQDAIAIVTVGQPHVRPLDTPDVRASLRVRTKTDPASRWRRPIESREKLGRIPVDLPADGRVHRSIKASLLPR